MKHLVHFQRPRLTESLATVGTFERFLFQVDELVVSEVILPSERLTADITGIGSLVGVGSFVDQEIVGLGKLSFAILADVPAIRIR